MGPPIGIDLGTTYSCVATMHNGKIRIIHNEQGNPTTPSYVAFKDDRRLIGDAAKNQVVMNALNTVYDSKRLIGRNFDDEKVQRDISIWSFKVVCSATDSSEIEVLFEDRRVRFRPEQISSMILENMKQQAELFLREEVTDAVITVPAYFNQSQRESTKLAGQIAGLNVLEIINEPTAAALAYGLQQDRKGLQNVLIFDLGGGTFDVSIINIANGDTFDVRAVAGDDHLGGEDFDNILVNHFALEFQRKCGIDIRSASRALARLRKECEKAKRILSSTEEAAVEIECLFEGVDFSSTITRARFELLCMGLFKSTIRLIERALDDARLEKSQIDEVVMVGGSTRIPKVRQMVSEYFGRKRIDYTINPDEAVAYGAAVRAVALMGGGTGNSNIKTVKLYDVVPLSLGFQVGYENQMCTVIRRNSKIPCEFEAVFSTMLDNQLGMELNVFEGERTMAADNHLLREFGLSGITPAPRGVTLVKTIFSLDNDGILTVRAHEIGKNNERKVLKIDRKKIQLTDAEVQRMIDDAKRYAKQDAAHKQRLMARRILEQYILKCQQANLNGRTSNRLTDEYRQIISERLSEEFKRLEHSRISLEVLEQRYRDLKNFIDDLVENMDSEMSEDEY